MNDDYLPGSISEDLVVQKILKLLENNTAFIGYALNGGIGTKINVRNTETGKTIQALSVNVDSSGEVLVVKDSNDGQYKAVTFKAAEQVTERIIQIRKTKPVDDKKIIEYTDSDIEVFYLFVKLVDTGSPVPSQLQSTWIRKGSSCTQFVGAYERCNYAAKETIGGTSYTGLPYKPYNSLNDCFSDDLGRDAKTPHGTEDENGVNLGWKMFSTKVTAEDEQRMLAALTSHDNEYGTSFKKLFGYGTILECSGGMHLAGWELASTTDSQTNITRNFFRCEFSFLPGFTNECTPAMQAAGYCDTRGFISSKAPLFGQETPGQPSVGSIDNSWGHTYGWVNLPYQFMYKRHFPQQYLNGSTAPGGFYILEVNEDQIPGNLPPNYFPWTPGCPSNLGDGGPYDGSGGNRNPDGPPKLKKRDMKLSTHKAEIWLGSSKKTEAIKLYELGASDLFSGMYNAFILAANETQVDIENRLRRNFAVSEEDQAKHFKFYENCNKNIIDLRIDPRVWIYVLNNVPSANYVTPNIEGNLVDPRNRSLQQIVDNLYQRTINLTVLDNKTQIVHLKLGLEPKNTLSNTDCKGSTVSNPAFSANDFTPNQSWEYRKYVTIKIKNWQVESTNNSLDTSLLPSALWNKSYIEKKFFVSYGSLSNNTGGTVSNRDRDAANTILLQTTNNTSINNPISGNNNEQYNYSQAKSIIVSNITSPMNSFVSSWTYLSKPVVSGDNQRQIMISNSSWWSLWDRSILDTEKKRLNSVVGYDRNIYQILTSYGLNSNLNYTTSVNNNQVSKESYFEYLTARPKVYVPSNIRSARNKLISLNNSFALDLSTRKSMLDSYGLNFFYTYNLTRWTQYTTARLDGINAPLLEVPSLFYSNQNSNNSETREFILAQNSRTGSYPTSSVKGIDTRQWFNNLWAQFIYDGFIKVDVDSYKDVEFVPPTNATQYIKYATDQIYANSEYNFVLNKVQDLETVLTPGVLDVTKQVTIKKPTNVQLDPNLSFLVYIYPYITVTKKKKEV